MTSNHPLLADSFDLAAYSDMYPFLKFYGTVKLPHEGMQEIVDWDINERPDGKGLLILGGKQADSALYAYAVYSDTPIWIASSLYDYVFSRYRMKEDWSLWNGEANDTPMMMRDMAISELGTESSVGIELIARVVEKRWAIGKGIIASTAKAPAVIVEKYGEDIFDKMKKSCRVVKF